MIGVLTVITVLALTVHGIKQVNLVLGDSVTLYCPVNAKGKDLYIKSITWSKDGHRFYSYDHNSSPYAMIANIAGIEIIEDVYLNGTEIIIGPATPYTAGFYRCVAELSNPHLRGLKFSLYVDTELALRNIR